MRALKIAAMVRVRQLIQAPEAMNAWRFNRRPPHVGDTGVIFHHYPADGKPDAYIVQMVDSEGDLVWLDTLLADELEPLDTEESWACVLSSSTT